MTIITITIAVIKRPSATVPSLLPLRESGTCYHWRSRHCRHCRLSSVHWAQNYFADCTTTHTSGNSSIDTSLIRDIYCGPEVLFETCVAMKFMDDDLMKSCNNVSYWKANVEPCSLRASTNAASLAGGLLCNRNWCGVCMNFSCCTSIANSTFI